MHNVANTIDRLAAPRDDDVADKQAGTRARPRWVNAYDENAAPTLGIL